LNSFWLAGLAGHAGLAVLQDLQDWHDWHDWHDWQDLHDLQDLFKEQVTTSYVAVIEPAKNFKTSILIQLPEVVGCYEGT
jgi:hypothetical protein